MLHITAGLRINVYRALPLFQWFFNLCFDFQYFYIIFTLVSLVFIHPFMAVFDL